MKRLVLILLLLAVAAPATADASVPCRKRIYNDWYPDGKIATTYPIACYRDALKHVKGDALVYSSLTDDIRSAMQGALERLHGKGNVPAQIGKGGKGAVDPAVTTLRNKKPHDGDGGDQAVSQTTTIAAPAASGGSGGVPTPILVLGGLALLLAAIGAIGTGAKRFRRR